MEPADHISQVSQHQMFAHLTPEERERIRQLLHSVPFQHFFSAAVFPLITSLSQRLDSTLAPDQTNYVRGYKAALTNLTHLVCTFAGMPDPLRTPLHFQDALHHVQGRQWTGPYVTQPPLQQQQEEQQQPDLPFSGAEKGSYRSGRTAFPA